MLKENGFVPMYQQIKTAIKASIDDGTYKPKEKIPSEPELSQEYGASRITVRRAVEELCNEGYLIKMQGRGTFVSAPRIHRKFTGIAGHVRSFTQACMDEGMTAGVQVLERQIVPVRKDEREFFHLEKDALLIHIERLRTADGQAVLLENHFFPYNDFKELMTMDLQDVSIFAMIEQVYGRKFSDTYYRTLEITKASSDEAQKMGIPLNEPLFYMNVYFLDQNNKPLCIGRQYYMGSRYMFAW